MRLWWKREPKRTSWVWCYNCGHDLNGDNESYVGEVRGIVTYDCASCHKDIRFDFVSYPVPVRL